MVHIRGHLTEREWNWLKAKLNNEFIDSEVAQSIKSKITTNEEPQSLTASLNQRMRDRTERLQRGRV